jgi:flagellar assembly factor FliW
MPTIETKYFGTVPCDEESFVDFPSGIPAFEDQRRFLRIERPAYHPLLFLQSAATPSLCFIAMAVLAAAPDYRLSVSPEDLAALDLPAGRQPRIGYYQRYPKPEATAPSPPGAPYGVAV